VRLFVALEIPAAVRENLAALIRELRPLAPQAKWVRAEKLHVTLKFIGEVPEELRAAVRENNSRDFGELRATEFRLVESRLKPAGAEYTSLATFPLASVEA